MSAPRLLAVFGSFVLFIGAINSRRALAADEWQPVTPEELKMTKEPEAPGAPAIVLYRQVDRNDDTESPREFNYVRVKILTEEGRKYGNVEIPFLKGRENINSVRARTIRPDGSIQNFDGKVFEKTIVKTRGVKYLANTFTLPDVQVGAIIEYHYYDDFESGYIFDSRWILSDELFTKHAIFSLKPFSRMTVSWSWPVGLPKGAAPPKEEKSAVRMEVQNVPAFQEEDFMPPEDALKLRVEFKYSEETPEKDPTKFWKQYGKKQNDQVESFVGKRKALEQVVSQTVSPGDAPEAKLKKIYTYVQHLRNLSFEVSKTEQEEKRAKLKDTNNVEDILKHGYGNGRELTWLFLGLARVAGFEAYPVVVSPRSHYFFVPAAMNPRQLNDNAVLVKLNGKDMYFDPGTAYAPFGVLAWGSTGATGLKLDKEGGNWIQTQLPGSGETRIERRARLKLTSEGDLEGNLKLTYTGLEALTRRLEERNEDDTEKKKYLEDEVKGYIPAGIDVELKNKPDWTDSAAPLSAEFELKVPGWASAAGKRALIPVALFGATEKRLFEHSDRIYPVVFPFQFMKVDDVVIQLPLGWKVANVPAPFDRDARAAEYTLKVENQNGTLHIVRQIRSDMVMLPKDSYPTLRTFFQMVRTQDDQQIMLQPDAASASN